jgi:hypothetical protein
MKAIIVSQGYTESEAHATGTEDLYFDIIRKFARENVTTYQPRRWNSEIEPLL